MPWDEYISREHAALRVEGKQLRVLPLPTGKNPITFRMQAGGERAGLARAKAFVIGETTFEVMEDPLQAGRRTATCTAVDFVQLVRIKADDFAAMLGGVSGGGGRHHGGRRGRGGRWICELLGRVQQASLSSFLEQELMQGQNLLLLDLDKCTRCDECVKACVATHDDGVTRLVRDGLRFENYLVATSCRACMDPLCMTRCPVGSIRRKATLDIVIEDWCIGCGNCATDCPYGNINVVQVQDPRPQAEGRAAAESGGVRSVRRISRSPTACAPARTTPPSGWSRRRSSRATWRACNCRARTGGRAVCPGRTRRRKRSRRGFTPMWTKCSNMLPRLKIDLRPARRRLPPVAVPFDDIRTRARATTTALPTTR